MKNITLITLLMSCCIFSCQAQSCTHSQKNETEKYTTRALNDTAIQKAVSDEKDDFPAFWTSFRQAVLSNDTVQLKKMVLFPVTIKGYEDNDPRFKIDENDFCYFFNIYLFDHDSSNYKETTRIVDATQEARYDEDMVRSPNLRRVEDLEFKRINGDWKVVCFYMDTRTYNNKNKK